MRRLSALDVAFLLMERRHTPLHVGALALFSPPKGSPEDFGAQLFERLSRSELAAPPFNRRPLTRLGVFYWDEDSHFDMAHHFVHISLPKPGRIRELLAMVSRVHSAHLDRAYPLWRVYLIEGLEDGRIALYMKIHHSLVDGVSGIRLLMKSMSSNAAQSLSLPPPWEVGKQSSGKPREGRPARGLRRARAQIGSLPSLLNQWRETYQDAREQHPDLVTPLCAPKCLLNEAVTGSRRFAAQSYSMPRIRAIAEALGGTANDVVVAMCGGALRTYLTELDALPDRPLVAGLPVSLHRDRDNAEPGNSITFMLAKLATDIADPAERFRLIKASIDYNKDRFKHMQPEHLLPYSAGMLAPGLVSMMAKGRRLPMNVVISHVPGPREPMYWQGCRLDGLYPVSLILDSMALNITLVSRDDLIDFGLIACRKTLPSVQRLLDYLTEALDELEQVAGTTPKRRRPAAKKRGARRG